MLVFLFHHLLLDGEVARINALGEGEASGEVVPPPPPVVGERELSPDLKGTMLASYKPAFGAPDVLKYR